MVLGGLVVEAHDAGIVALVAEFIAPPPPKKSVHFQFSGALSQKVSPKTLNP